MTQFDALKILKTGANVFLTGEPGSGKTHTINEYVAYLRSHEIEPVITASTGIAATHIHGMTIHSWSGIGIRKELTPYDLDYITSNEYVVKRVKKATILIIDEISMLDGKTLSMVERICREIKQKKEPFGGMQIVLVGDFFQLPPISRGVNNETAFAFNSPVWQNLNLVTCYLSEQHRQDDQEFLDLLSAIRGNNFSELHLEYLEKRVMRLENISELATKLYTHNVDVDRVNNEELAKIENKSNFYEMTGKGKEALVSVLKKGCLSPERLELKIGAMVMFTKNNLAGGFVNGTLGEVVSFDFPNNYPVVKTRGGSLIEVTPLDWVIEEDGKPKARISQLPLRLAWAITVHKSQGMSLDAAVMDLSGAFEYGQGYVALSRVRRLSGLFLLAYNQKAFLVHPQVLEEDQFFKSKSMESEMAFQKISASEIEKMHDNFILYCGGELVGNPPKAGQTKSGKNKRKGKKVSARGGSLPDGKAGASGGKKEELDENGEPKEKWLDRLRKDYPNAYRPWSKVEDENLRDEFAKNSDYSNIKEIARKFGRQKGSIFARLVKLGLVEKEGWENLE